MLVPGTAVAVVEPPATVADGASGVVELGGAAIAPDGTGGVVFTRIDGGAPHVYVARYVAGHWREPIRADWDRPYEATAPRIAAGTGGRLLVVWTTQIATVKRQIRRALVSATLGPGAGSFGPSLLVDGNVGTSPDPSPSLSHAEPGRALVVYRVVTNDFTSPTLGGDVPLRPRDVMADIRLARLGGGTWSRIGAINRRRATSVRAPTAVNGPLVGATADGNGVVAWQEPDQSGTARIWARRVLGTTPGPVLPATPATWDGRPLTADADALALDVTRFGLAQVVARIADGPESPLGGARLLRNALPIAIDDNAKAFAGAVVADGGPVAGDRLGPPSVAATEAGQSGALRLAYASGDQPTLVAGDDGGMAAPQVVGGPTAPAGPVVAVVDPGGGGVVGWPAADAQGRPGVAVRQDFPSGALQTAFLSGDRAGTVSQLTVGRSGQGDAAVAFLQGEPGRLQVVADRISVPPASFTVATPTDWVRPHGARFTWEASPSGVTGGVRYDVLLDGRQVVTGLRDRAFRPAATLLGSGVRHVRVRARDGSGQEYLSAEADLQVDARAPVATATRRGRTVTVRVRDPQSGVDADRTDGLFGDRTARVRGARSFRHRYRKAGRYTVRVRTRDTAGNRTTIDLPVRVR